MSLTMPPDTLERVIVMHVTQTVRYYHGNKLRAAKALGISRNTVKRYLDMFENKYR